MTAKNPITRDQVTTWDYGTTLTSSGVARNDLLASVAYPDSVSGSDVVSYAYNRLSEQRTIMDQRGTIRSFYRDLLARITNDCVTTVGSNTDATVLQIARAYDIRGMVNLITSTDSATQGAGIVLNQVALFFNDFRQLITDQQSHNGAVTSGTPSVQYSFDTGASSSNEIRLNGITYPNGRPISYSFGTAGGMSDYLNRVDAINDTSSGTVTLAQYLYLGVGTPIRITYPQPSISLDLWGGTSGVFAGFDRFGRVIDQRWQNNIGSTPMDIDRYKYGYDLNSNRLWKNNVVGTSAIASGLDELYALDPLNRLTEMQRGVLNSTRTAIIGTPVAEQDWTLDPVGNWSNFTTKSSGTTNLNQARSANTVNEITNITATTGPDWVIPEYDKAGNTITMPQVADPTQKLSGIFDAWNRLVILRTGSGGGDSGSGSSSSGSGSSSSGGPGGLLARYQYDGRNFRIVKDTYAGGTLSETRHFYFTTAWQDIEERVSGNTTADLQYVCGIRYIDELICRDDATPQRLYACQDANFNLTCVTSASGVPVERYLFDPYGLRTIMDGSWIVRTVSPFGWLIGHQGLMIDPETGLISNRARVLIPVTGYFAQRDPAEYSSGSNLSEYLVSCPTSRIDPLGLDAFGLPTTQPSAPPVKPSAGIGYVLAGINEYESRFKNCWLYTAAGLDKMFNAIRTAAGKASYKVLAANDPNVSGKFSDGGYVVNPSGWGVDTAVHESVHAFNYFSDIHQGNSGLLDDEGMAWSVQDMLETAQMLCNKFPMQCDSCAKAQSLWNFAWRAMDQIVGSPSGVSNSPPGTVLTRTNVWDVNDKLQLRFSEAQLRSLFQSALSTRNLNCTITAAPLSGGVDAQKQKNPFQ